MYYYYFLSELQCCVFISAVKRLFASKIKVFLFTQYLCVYCVYYKLKKNKKYAHIRYIFLKYVYIFTCIYLYSYNLHYIYIYINIFII